MSFQAYIEEGLLFMQTAYGNPYEPVFGPAYSPWYQPANGDYNNVLSHELQVLYNQCMLSMQLDKMLKGMTRQSEEDVVKWVEIVEIVELDDDSEEYREMKSGVKGLVEEVVDEDLAVVVFVVVDAVVHIVELEEDTEVESGVKGLVSKEVMEGDQSVELVSVVNDDVPIVELDEEPEKDREMESEVKGLVEKEVMEGDQAVKLVVVMKEVMVEEHGDKEGATREEKEDFGVLEVEEYGGLEYIYDDDDDVSTLMFMCR